MRPLTDVASFVVACSGRSRFLSGCSLIASFFFAFLSSSAVALGATPITAYQSTAISSSFCAMASRVGEASPPHDQLWSDEFDNAP